MMALAGLAAIMAVGTAVLGWWTVPVTALVAGTLGLSARPVRTGAAAGLLAWAALLVWRAAGGPVGALATLLGNVMGLPGPGVLAATLVFPALLGGAAAGVGAGLRSRDRVDRGGKRR